MSSGSDARHELHRYYEQELQHLFEMGSEFARAHPKIAGRLAWEVKDVEVADPYVERLRESFAFLAARVHMKLDAEFPRFTQHLLEMLLPGALEPLPSMAVVRLDPEPSEGTLSDGVLVPRGTVLRSVLGKSQQMPCDFRTGHDVTLWPIEVSEAEYLRFSGSTAGTSLPALPEIRSGQIRAGVRLRLRTTTGVRFDQLALDRLVLHMPASRNEAFRVYEQLCGATVRVVIPPPRSASGGEAVVLGPESVRPMGFDDAEALLPGTPRSFSGFRILREYSAFPARFLFVELSGLAAAVRRTAATEMDVFILLSRVDSALSSGLSAADFALHCTTAINLFPLRTDRIQLSDRNYEYQVVADRTRSRDLEIASITSVTGYAEGDARPRTFTPFYAVTDDSGSSPAGAYFTLRRTPRLMSERETLDGGRTGYLGSETYLSIVDASEAPYRSDLKQLSVDAMCTNRDLPLLMTPGTGRTDFTIVAGAPVRSVRILSGPSRPRPALGEDAAAWRLIGQIAEHQFGWMGADGRSGAAAIARMLRLHSVDETDSALRQREGVRAVTSRPIVRRLTHGPVGSWIRGIEVTLTMDDSAFAGSSAYLLAAVLEQTFARQVSINSFVETFLRTTERGEIGRWPARSGERRLA